MTEPIYVGRTAGYILTMSFLGRFFIEPRELAALASKRILSW
jgi:hypothetical protein